MPTETAAVPAKAETPKAAETPKVVTPPAAPAAEPKTPTPREPVPQEKTPRPESTVESDMLKLAKESFGGEDAALQEVPEKKPLTPAADPTKKAEPAKPAKEPVKAEVSKEVPAAKKDRFSDILPPDGATEKTLKGWDAFKTKANAEVESAEARYAAAQAELETMRKATPADIADVAKLKADHQAALDRLAVLDLSAHPDFHKQYIEPKQKALTEAKTLLADNAVENPPELADLMNKPRADFAKAVSELAAKMPAFDQGSFVAAMREARRLQEGEKGALSQASELAKQLHAKAAQEQRNAFDASRTDYLSKVPVMEIPDGASEQEVAEINQYNAAREASIKEAEGYAFGRLNERQVADLAIQAANLKVVASTLIPSMQRREKVAKALIAELTSELEAIKGKKAPGSFDSHQAPAARDPNKPMSEKDMWAEAERMSRDQRGQ